MDHEDEFLYTFFTHITQLCFDRAKESVEKERDSRRTTQMGPWGMLLMHLPQIAIAERSYVELGFLNTKNKSFLRKDNSLKSIYETLKSDLRRVEEMTKGTNNLGNLVSEISNQLCQFITARILLIDLYEKMYNMSIVSKLVKYHDLLINIENIIQNHLLPCSHFALNTMKTTLTLESEILMQLLKAYIEIQSWKFLPSLVALYGAQARMLAWEKTLQNKETWKLGFGASFLKSNQLPALYQWLVKLRSAILAKFSLYFYVTLSHQNNVNEIKSIMSKQTVDYYYKFQSFQKKFDISVIVIVFDSQDMDDSGAGYKHPDRDVKNSERFCVAVGIPQNFSIKLSLHWESIKKYIEQRHGELLASEKVLFNKNQNDQWIYAMVNIEPRMTFVVAYENCSRQRDKDSHVSSFMCDSCVQLRCNKIFESLKLSK